MWCVQVSTLMGMSEGVCVWCVEVSTLMGMSEGVCVWCVEVSTLMLKIPDHQTYRRIITS